ncbi:hypothetical protein MMC15_001706 [Xylographa vitiligo]|nr:hypothetical protein [Xylographa vitiligo]
MNMEFDEPFEHLFYLDLPDPSDPEAYGLVFVDAASPATSMKIAPFDGSLLDSVVDLHTNSEAVDGFLQRSVARLSRPDVNISVSSQDPSSRLRLHYPETTRQGQPTPLLTEPGLAILVPGPGRRNEETRPVQHTKSRNWEGIRDRVKVLYLEERNTLATTRRRMKNEYNLDASQKAFKQWIGEWGFKKYTKRPDQEYIVKMDQQRKLLSQKSSIFRSQGNIVSEAKVRKWAKVIDESTAMPVMLKVEDFDVCGFGRYTEEIDLVQAYKDKLKKWKMSKNLKLRQVKFMLKIAKKRKAEEGKETVFSYNGRGIRGVKLQRYSATISVNSIITSVPSLVTYHTSNIFAPSQKHDPPVSNRRLYNQPTPEDIGESPFLTAVADNSRPTASER